MFHIACISIAFPCDMYPVIPHFYIAKLGYAGVYLFFLFLFQNTDFGYSLEPPHKILLKIFNFLQLSIKINELHGRIFELWKPV